MPRQKSLITTRELTAWQRLAAAISDDAERTAKRKYLAKWRRLRRAERAGSNSASQGRRGKVKPK